MTSTKYILVAIDGTGSATWFERQGGASYTHEFYQLFGRCLSPSLYERTYFAGPDREMFGWDAGPDILRAYRFIKRSIEKLLPIKAVTMADVKLELARLNKRNTPDNVRRVRRDLIAERKEERRKKAKNFSALRIVLVGHSRGGAMAIEIARRLKSDQIPVYFMGLYDPVDRSPMIESSWIVNTRYTFRAVRTLLSSRWYFGNTGGFTFDSVATRGYRTSHGGTGGDVHEFPQGAKDDYSCTCDVTAADRVRYYQPSGSYHSTSIPLATERRRDEAILQENAELRYFNCVSESKRLRSDMLAAARDRGVPV